MDTPIGDPLITRSLPGGLWRFVPEPIKMADAALRDQAVSWSQQHPIFISWVEFFTEDLRGMLVALFVGIAITHVVLRRPRGVDRAQMQRWALYALALAFADISGTLIKNGVGRLKPHVVFYNPAVVPALSFPSGHSLNMSFMAVLLWSLTPPASRRRHPVYFCALFLVVIFVGLSRIFINQHYPIDVAAGFALGTVMALLVARIYRRVPAFKY